MCYVIWKSGENTTMSGFVNTQTLNDFLLGFDIYILVIIGFLDLLCYALTPLILGGRCWIGVLLDFRFCS